MGKHKLPFNLLSRETEREKVPSISLITFSPSRLFPFSAYYFFPFFSALSYSATLEGDLINGSVLDVGPGKRGRDHQDQNRKKKLGT